MKILIIGCGKLGAGLAIELYRRGHTINIIDKDEESFYRLGADFNGLTVVGNGYDKDTLEEAEIEYCDALVCATGNDDINAVAAKIGKDKYFVKYVIARLYNPKKGKVFEAQGIKTISTTGYSINRAIELLSFNMIDSVQLLGADASTEIVRIMATPSIDGLTLKELENEKDFKLIAVVRDGSSFIPKEEDVIQTHDILYFVTKIDAKRRLKIFLGI